MAGVKHTTSADGSFSPAGAAAWQEEHTLSDVASQTDLNTLSNALSILSATNSTEHAGLSNRITSVAGLAGGGGSVTSAEAQAISAAAQSAINTVSAAVNVVSNATSAEIVNRVSADNVLSANIASVDARATSIANALSALSNANSASHVSIDGRVTSVANAVSVLSQALSVLSQTNSAAHVSIDGRVTSVANAISVVSNALSALSQANSVDHAALSARITSVAGLGGGGSVTSNELSAVNDALSARLNSILSKTVNEYDVQSIQIQNITDDYISADTDLSLRINSAFGAVSNQLSQVSNYASIASNAASVAVQAASVASAAALALNAPQIRIVSNTQSTAGSALVDISGLVLTVAADQTWEINGMLLVSASAATVGFKGGCSVPVLSLPRYFEFLRLSQGQSAATMGGGGLLQVSGSSQLLSLAALGGAIVGITYQGVFNVASAGTFRMQYAGIASTAASPVHIMPGSYLKAIRLK